MKKNSPLIIFCWLVFTSARVCLAYNECALPAFIASTPVSNVLLAFDNSGSMLDLAYNDGENNFCYDDSYNPAATYYGYYENAVWYKYDKNDLSKPYFEEYVTSVPSGCDNPTGRDAFCILKNDKFYYFTGNFLNWLTMSKLDLIKKALTGGKPDDEYSSTLRGESRACVGRRFVKQYPVPTSTSSSNIAFAVLGSDPYGHGYSNIYVGGATRIEIYETDTGGFNFAPCRDAIIAIRDGNLGQMTSNTDDCLGLSSKSNALAAYNHSMQSCWSLDQGLGQGDISRIKNACAKVYQDVSAESLTETDAAYVCTKKTIVGGGEAGADLELGLGWCYAGGSWTSDECIGSHLDGFCRSLAIPEVIDPSNEFEVTGDYRNVPSMLIDSGVIGQLGDPLAVIYNRKQQNSEPSGILQEVKDKVNIGLIAMSHYGSKYEPLTGEGYFYAEEDDKDGGVIKSEIQGKNTEIISAFNDLTGNTWTPIGEMFYEATRYFAGKSSAYTAQVYTSPLNYACQSNVVILLSDGSSTYDQNLPGTYFSPGKDNQAPVSDAAFAIVDYLSSADYTLEVGLNKGTKYAKGVACWAHTNDISDDFAGDQTIDFYTMHALGSGGGDSLLQEIAKYGGFEDDGQTTDPCKTELSTDQWDRDGDGLSDHYSSVSSFTDLVAQLENIFSKIINRFAAAGAVATVTQQVEGEDVVIRGAFKTYEDNPRELVWQGHLEAYWAQPGCAQYYTSEADCTAQTGCRWEEDGQCVGTYSFEGRSEQEMFCSDHHERCWDAQERMPGPRNKLYTMTGGVQKEFNVANICADDWLALGSDESYTTADCPSMVGWIIGTNDGWEKARNRNGWLLGDIAYSTPLIVGAPSLGSVDKHITGDCACDCIDEQNVCAKQCFYCFADKYRYRKKMVYAGSNDGMLHAFVAAVWVDSAGDVPAHWAYDPAEDAQIGKELWAYIPSNLLSELKELARTDYGTDDGCPHRTMVDLSPQAWDVFIDPSGNNNPNNREWRTVLIGGERGGGDVYFAIDVTEPDNMKVLWEYSVLRNLVQLQPSGSSYNGVWPYRDLSIYDQVKNLPISYSVPYVGKLDTSSLSFRTATRVEPLAAGNPTPTVSDKGSSLSGWFAFFGGGARIFDLADLVAADSSGTVKPYLFAIDIEQGINIFQYLWPMVQTVVGGTWDNPVNGTPFAVSSPAVLDVWDADGKSMSDGYIDHIYLGDLNGQFYSMKFNLDSANKGLKIDVWKTKPIIDGLDTNSFRSDHQPISVMPSVAFDPYKNLLVYFGTGKFENVGADNDDRSDTARMSFYAFKDAEARPEVQPACTVTGTGETFSINCATPSFKFQDFGVEVNFHCSSTSYNSGCSWTKADGAPDCCQSSCVGSCWNCVYDFTHDGERVTDYALVAGELVFFTAFVPRSDLCDSEIGDAYLYILDYQCGKIGADPLTYSGKTKIKSIAALAEGEYAEVGDENGKSAYVVKLGVGMPSRPVLDSSGKYVVIQRSNGVIDKIRVELPISPFYRKGWKEDLEPED